MPGAQAKQLIRTTKAMYQAQLEMLPENAVMFAVPHKDDGKGGKRKSIYEGMGFKSIPGLKTDRLWALKNQGKFTEIPDSQMEYMAGLIRGDAANAPAAGKPCGNSYIPKKHECSKTAGADNPEKKSEKRPSTKRLVLAGALAGAAALAVTAPQWTPAAQRILNNAKPFDKNNPPQGAKYLTEGVSGRTWISQDDKYVIKTPKGKVNKAAFANEVNTQNALHAAGISVPKIHNVDSNKGVVMMDYLKGYDTVKSLGTEQKGKAVQSALREVEKMHRLGYSHGDLHMGNVLTKGSDVKLIDFGTAGPVAKNGLSDINSLLSAAKDSNPRLYTVMTNRKKALQTKISSGESLTQKDLVAFHEAVRKDLRRPT
jgi:tRNA A-37 threonylcarbamoyl transferase component Bud32